MHSHAAWWERLSHVQERHWPRLRLPAATRGRLYRLAGAGLAVGVGAAVLLVRSSHFDFRPAVIGLGLLTGWSFVGSGLVALRRRTENRFGWLLMACGFAWFAAALPASNWSPLFTLGLLLAPLYAAVLVHTILAFPSGSVEGGLASAAVFLAYGGFVLLQLPYVLVTIPIGGSTALVRTISCLSRRAAAPRG